MCDEDFGSDEEGEEGDVESYLEDNSSELMDRLRELEVRGAKDSPSSLGSLTTQTTSTSGSDTRLSAVSR